MERHESRQVRASRDNEEGDTNPLADFGAVKFTGVTTSGSALGSFEAGVDQDNLTNVVDGASQPVSTDLILDDITKPFTGADRYEDHCMAGFHSSLHRIQSVLLVARGDMKLSNVSVASAGLGLAASSTGL
jgi:hypothetical protein